MKLFSQPHKRIGVAIGDKILDLSLVCHHFTGPKLVSQQHVFREVGSVLTRQQI